MGNITYSDLIRELQLLDISRIHKCCYNTWQSKHMYLADMVVFAEVILLIDFMLI